MFDSIINNRNGTDAATETLPAPKLPPQNTNCMIGNSIDKHTAVINFFPVAGLLNGSQSLTTTFVLTFDKTLIGIS